MLHAGSKPFELCGPKCLLASLITATKILAHVPQWMPPTLPTSPNSRLAVFKSCTIRTPHQALFPVEVLTEGGTTAAVSSTRQWFRLGRAQPLGCGRMGISLEEILKQVSPMVVCPCAVPPFC